MPDLNLLGEPWGPSVRALAINIVDFGAVGDWNGATGTDNATAVQSALKAAAANGGGRVYIPAGNFLCAQALTNQASLYIAGDNIELFGAGPSSVLVSNRADNLGVIYVSGGGKTGQVNPFITNNWWEFRSFAPISAAAKGAMSVTCAISAHANQFAAGDLVFIRTGNWNVGSQSEPDGELLEVESVSAPTVTFRSPLLKVYSQEYFAAGNGNQTTITADAAVGATQVTVALATGFAVNDQIELVGAGGASHAATITAVNGTTFTFSPAITIDKVASGASITNAKGVSSTTSSAKPCILGIAKVTAVTNQNLYMHDFKIDHQGSGTGPPVAGGQQYGWRIERMHTNSKSIAFTVGRVRDWWVTQNRIHRRAGGGSGVYHIGIGPSTVCVDILNNHGTCADNNTGVAVSEGTAICKIDGNTFVGSPTSTGSDLAITMQSGSRGIIVTRNHILNGGNDAAITVQNPSGKPGYGIISNNIIEGTNMVTGVSLGDPGWLEHDNYVVESTIAPQLQSAGGAQRPMERKTFSGFVRFDRTSVQIGTISGKFKVLALRAFGTVAFNGGGNNRIMVNYDGSTSSNAVGNFATATSGVLTPATSPAVNVYDTVARTIFVVYDGTSPTTGQIQVEVDVQVEPADV